VFFLVIWSTSKFIHNRWSTCSALAFLITCHFNHLFVKLIIIVVLYLANELLMMMIMINDKENMGLHFLCLLASLLIWDIHHWIIIYAAFNAIYFSSSKLTALCFDVSKAKRYINDFWSHQFGQNNVANIGVGIPTNNIIVLPVSQHSAFLLLSGRDLRQEYPDQPS